MVQRYTRSVTFHDSLRFYKAPLSWVMAYLSHLLSNIAKSSSLSRFLVDDRSKKLVTFFIHCVDILIIQCYYNGDVVEDNDRDILTGKCPKCRTYYYGWALLKPRHQICPKCGVGLEISDSNGHTLFEGYSPFSAERHTVKSHNHLPSSHDKEKTSRGRKKWQRSWFVLFSQTNWIYASQTSFCSKKRSPDRAQSLRKGKGLTPKPHL